MCGNLVALQVAIAKSGMRVESFDSDSITTKESLICAVAFKRLFSYHSCSTKKNKTKEI
jgi:hypothetical protein